MHTKFGIRNLDFKLLYSYLNYLLILGTFLIMVTLTTASPLFFCTITSPTIPNEELVAAGSRTPVVV